MTTLYESLKHCTLLQSLSIQCSVLKRISNDVSGHCPFIFIDTLADVLFSPKSGPHHPTLPELETLSIERMRVSKPVPPGCADACKNLARALEDRSRCPRLQRLNISVSVILRTREASDTLREIAEQEPVLRSYFEGVVSSGVQLRVGISLG